MLFVDLDDFKTVNDTLGHAVGDQLLVAVAERLRRCVRPSDTVARLGGDEFAVLLDRLDGPEDVVVVAERILAALAQRVPAGDEAVSVGASVGIATSHAEATRAGELIRDADVAMYEAKQRGKGRCARFERSMHAAILRRHGLKEQLQQAVDARRVRRRVPADRRPRDRRRRRRRGAGALEPPGARPRRAAASSSRWPRRPG